MDVRLSEFRIDGLIPNAVRHDPLAGRTKEHRSADRPGRGDAAAVPGSIEGAADFDEPALECDQIHARRGRITVAARGDGRGNIEISVEDTGVGIAEVDREIIFEKFRRETPARGRDNLTREYSGTGLGLSIVKELCRLLGAK